MENLRILTVSDALITRIDNARLQVLAPAKINLFLEVRGKRPDGYHELYSLMVAVGLYDALTLTTGKGATRVTCNDPQVPENETNLAFRAAALFQRWSQRFEGVHIHIDKQIPVAAGLGGGSSDAAAVLRALNWQHGQPFDSATLMKMGLTLGADVPFFLYGKPALASGIGEHLEACENLEPHHVLLVYPGVGIATADVFKNLNLRLTKCKKALKYFPFRKQNFDISRYLCNDLETVTAARYPVVEEAKRKLASLGASGTLMSGSGTTVFGLFKKASSARRAYRILASERTWRLYVADLML
jgi:4-diphosphocytidyl-2-C-methyl-D-erythritol kinase